MLEIKSWCPGDSSWPLVVKSHLGFEHSVHIRLVFVSKVGKFPDLNKRYPPELAAIVYAILKLIFCVKVQVICDHSDLTE